jgi:hypothetical protein
MENIMLIHLISINMKKWYVKGNMPVVLSKKLSLKEQVYLEFIYKFYSLIIDRKFLKNYLILI